MNRLLLILAILFPLSASAGWVDCTSGSAKRTVQSPGSICYETSGTTDSSLIYVGGCWSYSVQWEDDMAAATRGCEGYVRACASWDTDTYTATNICEPVYSDAGAVTLNGDPSTGRRWLYNYVAEWIYVDIVANAGSDACRVQIFCR